MPIKPPKCRTCGREEWNHVCNKTAREALVAMAAAPKKAPTKKQPAKKRGK